ncbi:MAG: hypothetical protein NTZ05_01455 [Chloroflexi bacterium]|nr:hypothetical protein [Chloroflexota bacterium]
MNPASFDRPRLAGQPGKRNVSLPAFALKAFLVLALTLANAAALPEAARASQRVTTLAPSDAAPHANDNAALQSDGLHLEMVGQVGGVTLAVAARDGLAYLGVGSRVVVLNVSDPAHPALVSQSVPLTGVVRGLALTQQYAYVITQNHTVHTIDIVDSKSLRDVGSASTTGDAQAIAIAGNLVAVAAADAGLQLFSLAGSAPPIPLGSLATPGPALDVAIAGRYAYVAAAGGGLRVVDIMDPAHPSETGSYEIPAGSLSMPGQASGIAVADGYAYLAAANAGIRAVSIADPAHPAEIAHFDLPGGATEIRSANGALYAAGTEGLSILRFDDAQRTLTVVGKHAAPWTSALLDLNVTGETAYVTEATGSLRIIAIANSSAPAAAGSFTVAGNMDSVAVTRGYAFVWDYLTGMHIFSLTDPTNPREVGTYLPRGGVPNLAAEIAVRGDYAYVPGGDGLYIVDVRDVAHPFEAGFLKDELAQAITVANGYLYVGQNSMSVWSLANPAKPVLTGRYTATSSPPVAIHNIVIRGTYAYLAGFYRGLTILDIADPAQPKEIAQPGGYWAPDLAVAGDYAYVVDGGFRSPLTGVLAMHVADPAHASQVSMYESPGRASGVAAAHGNLYVSAGSAGVRVLSLADPAHPSEIGYFNTPGGAFGVRTAGEYIYAIGGGGLSILRFAESAAVPVLAAPAEGAAAPGIAVDLRWRNPPGTAQVEVRLLPAHNNGPGLDMIYGSPRGSQNVPAPILGSGPYVLLPDMGYTWQVRSATAPAALDVDSPEWGAWSAPGTFRTPSAGAAGIRPAAPQPGSTNVPLQQRLSWEDNRSDVFYYEIQVSRDPTFETHPGRATAAVFWNLVHGGETSPRNSWAVPEGFRLEPGQTYFWRVRPRIQGDGTPVGWSATWNFTTGAG